MTEPLPSLARWDEAVFDGPQVVAAPTVAQAERLAGDIATFGSVRTSLLWRGLLKPTDRAPCAIDAWPTTPTPKEPTS